MLQGTAAGNSFITIQGLLKDRVNKQFMQNKYYIFIYWNIKFIQSKLRETNYNLL